MLKKLEINISILYNHYFYRLKMVKFLSKKTLKKEKWVILLKIVLWNLGILAIKIYNFMLIITKY